jgi:hypothetical protein
MFNFLKKYTKRNSEPFLKMFPESLSGDVERVVALLPTNDSSPQESKTIPMVVDSQHITICSRIYKKELDESLVSSLNNTQKLILSCIYTRHQDGFVREKHLKNLLVEVKSWTVPFIIMLLGEYVVEIISLIREGIADPDTQKLYNDFIVQNPVFWASTKSRIVSYWDVYYRDSFKDKEDYPGMEVIKMIEDRSVDQGSLKKLR